MTAESADSDRDRSAKDVTERLRAWGRWVVTDKGHPMFPQTREEEWQAFPLAIEAADEIDRLREENRQFREQFADADDIRRAFENWDGKTPPNGWIKCGHTVESLSPAKDVP